MRSAQPSAVVTLVTGKPEASIAIRPPAGARGGLHSPKVVSIEPFLKAGLSEAEAIEKVLELVSIGLEGQEIGNA